MKTRQPQKSIRSLMDDANRGLLILQPQYQRYYQWTPKTASKLIESILRGFIINPIHLAVENRRREVIDGQQRLTSLFSFMNGDFALIGLDDIQELNGMKFSDLPEHYQCMLEDYEFQTTEYYMDNGIPLKTKCEIFERLNIASRTLNKQEIRNAVYYGKFNEFIKELAKYPRLQEILRINKARMTDVEYVLKFFAVIDKNKGKAEYTYSEKYLDKYMENNRNVSEFEQRIMKEDFYKFIDISYEIFGINAFRNTNIKNHKLNAKLFIVLALIFSLYPKDKIMKHKDAVATCVNNFVDSNNTKDLINDTRGNSSNSFHPLVASLKNDIDMIITNNGLKIVNG